jgi:hypothetical protein
MPRDLLGIASAAIVMVISVVVNASGSSLGLGPAKPPQEAAQQLQELDRVKTNLNGLLTFVEKQKKRVTQDQETIARLTQERTSLESLVNIDRQTVNRLFEMQESRAQQQKLFDYISGFFLGVASSIVATIALRRFSRGKQAD